MDFRRLARSMPAADYSYEDHNTTEPDLRLTELPPNILDALIPGYAVISRWILATFNFDISLFVSAAVIAFGVFKGGQILWRRIYQAFRYLFISSVHIDEADDLYDTLMDWLCATQLRVSRRSVKAKTQYGANQELEADVTDSLGPDGLFDYNKWSARTPPQYQPYYGSNYFWHESRVFFFSINQKQREAQTLQMRWGGGGVQEENIISIDCIGRSIQPIRELLRTAKVWSLDQEKNHTQIRHPAPKDRTRYGGAWMRTFSRPSRPMNTVILDAEQKEMIIRDMNEYLHPASPKWYATRGIPYRRGYLFHGPPGTGKTSLSFALAGIFGLDIYCISLQEPSLTESDLMQLFNSLQRRCIVLLEDVDAAGLIRDEQSDPTDDDEGGTKTKKIKGKKKGKKGSEKSTTNGKPKDEEAKKNETTKDVVQVNGVKSDEDYTLKDLAQELKSLKDLANQMKSGTTPDGKDATKHKMPGQGAPSREPGAGISLSGLLNAIDGVASHEGRVLIMTTNHPDKLDAALVRPGRIDRRVGFGLAAGQQIIELFMRMYSASDVVNVPEVKLVANGNGVKAKVNGSATGEKHLNGHASPTAEKKERKNVALEDLSRADLEELAEEFAAQIPDNTFTPAEIQNHLMRYKKEPGTALANVKEWMEEVLKEKKKRADKSKPEKEDEDHKEDSDGESEGFSD